MNIELVGNESDFQKNLLIRLDELMSELDGELVNFHHGGKKEIFIEGSIKTDTHELKCWIYWDGAEFTDMGKLDKRYEAVDFDRAEDLIDAYIQDLKEVLS